MLQAPLQDAAIHAQNRCIRMSTAVSSFLPLLLNEWIRPDKPPLRLFSSYVAGFEGVLEVSSSKSESL